MFGLPTDSFDRAQVERVLADARVKLLRKIGEKVEAEGTDSELNTAADEEFAVMLVSVALPAERQRIPAIFDSHSWRGGEQDPGNCFGRLGDLWDFHPPEKIVIFTTYLGSVSSLHIAIESAFPSAGVEVLKGGDHGAKLAAETPIQASLRPKCAYLHGCRTRGD